MSISGDGTTGTHFDMAFLALGPRSTSPPTRNSAASGARSVELYAGQSLANVDFALMPSRGEIRGRCFQDLIANGISDVGEPGHAGHTVFIDANANGRLDPGEVSTSTGTDGTYAFTNLPSEMEYRIATIVPHGSTLVLPSADENGVWRVFLPAGGTITESRFRFA